MSATWVADRLREKKDVKKVDVIAQQVLRISRAEHPPFVAGIVSSSKVVRNVIEHLVTPELQVEIIANIPKDSFWAGDALALARRHHIATGAFGDLLRVLDRPDVRAFVPAETAFIERGLTQHRRVTSFDRLHDRIYRIELRGGDDHPDLTVAMLNAYELTAEDVRAARERYGDFSVVVITNPNGRATSSALQVGRMLSIEIFDWAEFYGYLNSR